MQIISQVILFIGLSNSSLIVKQSLKNNISLKLNKYLKLEYNIKTYVLFLTKEVYITALEVFNKNLHIYRVWNADFESKIHFYDDSA